MQDMDKKYLLATHSTGTAPNKLFPPKLKTEAPND